MLLQEGYVQCGSLLYIVQIEQAIFMKKCDKNNQWNHVILTLQLYGDLNKHISFICCLQLL